MTRLTVVFLHAKGFVGMVSGRSNEQWQDFWNMAPDVRRKSFEEALLSLDRMAARAALNLHNDEEGSLQFLEDIVVPALESIGKGWEEGRISLAQVYMAGRITEELMEELLPPKVAPHSGAEMAIAVLEDYHLLGKRLVCSVLRSAGFHVADYGRMNVDDLVQRVKSEKIRILLISTLMLPSALNVKAVREGLTRAGADVKIVVGGAPFRFDDQLWLEVGADATASTASGAIHVVQGMWKELR